MNYEQAVAREEENRLIALLGVGRPLFGEPLACLSWGHMIELVLIGNAFALGVEAKRRDVYRFLWRLHLYFTRPDGSMPNLPAGVRRPGLLARQWVRFRLWRMAYRMPLPIAEKAIFQWIAEAYQDRPTSAPGEEVTTSSLSPKLSWFDYIASKYEQLGYTPAQIHSLGIAYTFQMERARLILIGQDARCVPPSASLKHLED